MSAIAKVIQPVLEEWFMGLGIDMDSTEYEQLAVSVAARLQPAWTPLSHQTLMQLDAGDFPRTCWLYAPSVSDKPFVATYEWRQGVLPHGFNSDRGRVYAIDVTHVMPFVEPAPPAGASA